MHSISSAAWNCFPVYFTFLRNEVVTKFERCLIMIHDSFFFFGPVCHLAVTRQSRWFQVKLSTIKWLSEWVCVDALLISSYDALASRLPLFGLFPCRFTLLVREQPWTELRWGMALSDHHYTSPPFHLHLIILISPWGRVRARLFVFSVLSCFTFECACASVRERQCRRRRRRKMREGKGEKGASIWYSHYTSCRFHLHLIVCLIAGKKQVIYQAWRGSWSLFPRHDALCVCLFVFVCVCKCVQHIHSDDRSIRLCAMTQLWVWIVTVSPYKKLHFNG